METFLGETRGSVANLMTKELQDLDSTKVQTTAWIRFKVEADDGDGNVIRVDMAHKAFNSRTMEVFKGSNLNDKVFAHMKTQVGNLALANSRFVVD